MDDPITQMRLSMRLERYQREYTEKNVKKVPLSREAWETAWQVADVARANHTLTPVLVDDVRIALNTLSV